MGQYATRVARLLVWCVLAALTCGASAACSGGGLLRLRGGGAVELTEIKDFLQITRRADARHEEERDRLLREREGEHEARRDAVDDVARHDPSNDR